MVFGLQEAIALAVTAHQGQFDKAGEPYILHPLAVMLSIDPWLTEQRIVAVLHDVLEDSDLSAEDLLRRGCPGEIVEALVVLTHRKGQSYAEYIRDIKANPIAAAVKLADLRHNTSMERLLRLDQPTVKRLLAKYEPAIKELTA
jgi:(p)ppGpp synthase/HD superfamily hydrolase